MKMSSQIDSRCVLFLCKEMNEARKKRCQEVKENKDELIEVAQNYMDKLMGAAILSKCLNYCNWYNLFNR